MDSGLLLLVLIALAFPFMAIAAFVMVLGARGRIALLERRLAELEAGRAAPDERVAATQAEPEDTEAEEEEPAELVPPPLAEPRPADVGATPILTGSARGAAEAPGPQPAGPGWRERLGGADLETLLGARWAVLVGGLALALGGIFLVRYSIEEGYFGPAARITAAGLFAAVLIAAGEWFRRREPAGPLAGMPVAYVPGVLTAAGVVSAFATVYAAYALYGFLAPAAAFLLLGLVGAASLVASVLHGPALAGLGVLGAAAAPALVESDDPNAWILFVYLLAVFATSLGIARLRTWRWLAVASGVAALGWGFLYAVEAGPALDPYALITHAGLSIALLAAYHASGTQAPRWHLPDFIVCGLIGGFGLLAIASVIEGDHDRALLVVFTLMLAALLLLAGALPRLAPLAPTAAVLAVLSYLAWNLDVASLDAGVTALPPPGELPPAAPGVRHYLAVGGAEGLMFLLLGLLGAWMSVGRPVLSTASFASASIAAPLGLLAVAYVRVAGLAPSMPFATVAAALAAVSASLTEHFVRREVSSRVAAAGTAAYAVGGVAGVGLALAMALSQGALTVALAFVALGAAFVATRRPILALRPVAIVTALLVLGRIVWDPMIVGAALSPRPVFNELLWGYGLPLVAFAGAAALFRRAGSVVTTGVMEALAFLFAALLFGFEIRHATYVGDLTRPAAGVAELGLDVVVAFALAAVARLLGARRPSPVRTAAALVFSLLSIASALIGLLVATNPFVTGEPIGEGLLVNALLPGYLLPALAAAGFTVVARRAGAEPLARLAGGTALVVAFAYVTLEVRATWHRPFLDEGGVLDVEQYAYSVAWLVFGIALLAAGAVSGSRALRLGSAAVTIATVLKVFLWDMGDLTGVLRALSFIGLGLVLIGIGLLYQRLLFGSRGRTPPS